jgi:hypothetical protein
MPDTSSDFQETQRLPRRAVLKWFAAAAAAAAADLPEIGAASAAKGYGMDPVLAKIYNPGDFWPLTLTKEQRETVTALADVILPADHLGPAASEVRVPDFIDEWLSAPYPAQQKDAEAILPGLKWLETECAKRFGGRFAALTEAQKHELCDAICYAQEAKAEYKKGASFFAKFRTLAASAYYGTEAGWKAIGYVGNVPTPTFEGPPPEVLAILGVEQTVK